VSEGPERGRRELHLLLFATPLAPLVGLLPGGAWLFPLLAPLTLFGGFARAVRTADYWKAFRRGLLWAALLSASVILFVHVAPAAAAHAILNAEPYRQEMFGWIETGVAKENDWRQFLPDHLLHLGVFIALAWLSGGYLALALGAVLTSYMSYFVGSFAVATGAPVLGSLAAWVPWSVVRVLSFVALGCLLARPLLLRRAWPFGARERRWALAALLGILVDILTKAAIAPAYGLFLRRWLAGE
jgi:hypothetical protein